MWNWGTWAPLLTVMKCIFRRLIFSVSLYTDSLAHAHPFFFLGKMRENDFVCELSCNVQDKWLNKAHVFLFCFFYRMSIVNIVAREILDSRGNPTVEVDLHTGKGWKINPLKSGTHILYLSDNRLDGVPYVIYTLKNHMVVFTQAYLYLSLPSRCLLNLSPLYMYLSLHPPVSPFQVCSGLLCPAVHPPASTKLWSSGMETRHATRAKVNTYNETYPLCFCLLSLPLILLWVFSNVVLWQKCGLTLLVFHGSKISPSALLSKV